MKFRCVPAKPNLAAKPVAPAKLAQAEPPGNPTHAEVEKTLEDLKGLLGKGLISREDYDRKKKEVLDRM